MRHLIFWAVLSILASEQRGFSANLEKVLRFRISDVTFLKEKGYDIVQLEGCDLTSRVGFPALPKRDVKIVLPSGAMATKVEVISATQETLPGEFNILLGQFLGLFETLLLLSRAHPG